MLPVTVAGEKDATIRRPASNAPAQTQATKPDAAPVEPLIPATENWVPATENWVPATENWADPLEYSGVWEEACEGMVLKEKYRLDQRVGEGGMGIVFRATDLDCVGLGNSEPVAVKVLKPEFRTHPDALFAMNEEVRKGRVLASPHIVAAYSFNRDKNQIFMTMEFVSGKALDALIEEDFARGMRFDRAVPIIEDMVDALAEAHKHGIIHSDFKPSNVIVGGDG